MSKLSDAAERIAKEARRQERVRILAYMRTEIVLGEEAQCVADVIAEEIEELNHYAKRGEDVRVSYGWPPEHHNHVVVMLDKGGYCEDCRVELPKANVELIRDWEHAEAWKRAGVR